MKCRMTEILTELGRRMTEKYELRTGNYESLAARNVCLDMLSAEYLAAWSALYPALPVDVPRNVLVVMAGNIPFVGMHDLVCVLAAGHRAIVKPSSKDLENMSWVVSQLLDIEPTLPVSLLSDNAPAPDAVIAMGGNEAMAAIAEKYEGIPMMLLRGNRSSAAVLDGSETSDELAGLAGDILSYSGLGCRSVSLLFVPHGYDFYILQNAIIQQENSVELRYRNSYRQARAMLRMGGVSHIDCGISILVEHKGFSANISVLNYVYYDNLCEVNDWMTEHDTEIQCVTTNSTGFRFPRAVPLGTAQRPRLTDYPDGHDTMHFLMSI